MSILFKRWRLLTVALVTALAVFAGTTSAFAAQPGEGTQWSDETTNGNSVQTQDTYGEAYGGITGNRVNIFRGDTDNHVWVSVNGGGAFGIGSNGNPNTTQTLVAPRVIYSNNFFYAFHTGTDGFIYWSRVADTTLGAGTPAADIASQWSNWTQITGNFTNQSVSVASDPFGLLMTYRGRGADTRLWSAWLNVGSDVFNSAVPMGGQVSNSAPVVSYSPVFNTFTAVFRGLLDNQVYRMSQVAGQTSWSDPVVMSGITTGTSPVVADDSQGNQLIAAVDLNGGIHFEAIEAAGLSFGWSTESAGMVTDVPVFLSVANGVFFVLATAIAANFSLAQFKPAWSPSKGI